MRRNVMVLVAALGLVAPLYGRAQPSKPDAKVEVTKTETKTETKTTTTAASQPATKPAPVDPAVKQPTSGAEAFDAGKDFVGAIKAKRWWFAAAGGIFLLMFVLGVAGLWVKIGTTWAWVAVGVLSIAAGCFAAFDSKGFNWGAFFGYISAGPTVAWLRDWIKDGIAKIKKKE